MASMREIRAMYVARLRKDANAAIAAGKRCAHASDARRKYAEQACMMRREASALERITR